MQDKIRQIEEQYNVKVLMFTKVGSHLYGTNGEGSDVDYKGIFLPSKESLLTDSALNFIDLSTNKSGEKNTAEDIDLTLSSVQSWAKQLASGETGALDLLFSLWKEVEFVDRAFLRFVMSNYKSFLSNKPKAFIGYANQQAKKYSLKKDRYQELQKVIALIKHVAGASDGRKMQEDWQTLKDLLTKEKDEMGLKYTEFVMAPGPRKAVQCEYLEVLGRKFHPSVTFGHILGKLSKVEKDYGNRAKGCETPTEWKSLSHAVRIMDEIEELLDTQFITFPLPNADFIKEVKAGNVPQEEVTAYMEAKLTRIDDLVVNTKLPAEPNLQPFTDWLTKRVYL